jgi:hypothetical protein
MVGILPQASFRLTAAEGSEIPSTCSKPFATVASIAWCRSSHRSIAAMPEKTRCACLALLHACDSNGELA